MSAYLSPTEIAASAEEIQSELDRLLSRRNLVRRPGSRQWSFLRHCLQVTLDGRSADFPCDKGQALQYKFEVEDRLRRYYVARGQPVRFVFRLMHADKAQELGLVDDGYPTANSYVLLIAPEGTPAQASSPRETKEVLERVVTESTDAEWAVYAKLPEVDLGPLDRTFLREGSAYKRIAHLAERHHERQWTLSTPANNPSTKRVLAVKVVSVGAEEAVVQTKEYWYLRWFSIKVGDYAQVDYRETNTQKYILVKREARWMVESNIYPPPRAQAPHRKKIVVG